MSDCLVTNFGLLTNGAFSVCFRRGVAGGGAHPIKQEAPVPRMVITKIEEEEDDTPIKVIIKRLT
jgi:hypothetical protein